MTPAVLEAKKEAYKVTQGEFPSNSQKSKNRNQPRPEEKKELVRQITRGEVSRRKKPLGRKFAETFFGGTDATSIWSFVMGDVIVPGTKDMVYEMFMSGLDRLMFGESSHGRRRRHVAGRHPASGPYVQYNRPVGRQESHDPRRPQISRRARASHDFDEIVLETRVEAEEVIDRLYELVSKFETATVADLYEMVGIDGNYMDDKWGWFELPGARVQRVRDGYLLDLPKPEPLD